MERELVTTEEVAAEAPQFVLLSPSPTPAREGKYFQKILDYTWVPSVLRSIAASKYVAIDFETRGNDPSTDELSIVGVGFAWDKGSCYFDWRDLSLALRETISTTILHHPGLLAHNVYFDGGVLLREFGTHAKWEACTLALYMMLANEGWAGQQHGLKKAQTDVLLWESSNETELDEWLITNSFYKGTKLRDESPSNLLQKAKDGSLKPDKGAMWRAPKDILGKYCILDAESCYLLFTCHLLPAAQLFPEFYEWFRTRWMTHIRIHIDQKMHGIHVDRSGLQNRRISLACQINDLEEAIRTHPLLVDDIATIESELLATLKEKEPTRWKKEKVRPPEPPKFRKDGKLSKNWELWVSNEHKYQPEISKNWINWHQKYLTAEAGKDPDFKFNLNSGPQLVRLFYELGGNEVRVLTDSKLPGTGIKALKHFDDVGKLFIQRAYAEKELSYVVDYLQRTETRPTIHPSFRLPGTKTGRLSSKAPNLQQVPKSKAMMSLFQASPGTVWVDLDFSALEPVVATEFSNDPNMQLIYADGRPPNDIYLFVAASIPGIREKVLAAGYDPKHPTKEGIANAKKVCKHERSICKTVTLACQYGAGVNKVMQTLEQDDVFLSEEEVKAIHSGYWNLFRQVKQMGYDLQREWKNNGGYVVNGMGRPMCLTEDYKHDVLNRFIQSTGHDILVEYCYHLERLLNESGIPWKPVVWDWHDAATVEVPDGTQDQVAALFIECLRVLNNQIGGSIKLKGVPTSGYTLADVKEPEE